MEQNNGWISFLSAVIRKPDGGIHRLPLSEKDLFQILKLEDPLVSALKHDELDDRGYLVEPAESPDKNDNWNRYADQPKQKTSTHDFLLIVSFRFN